MPNDAAVRDQLLQVLRGGHAHATFDDAVAHFQVEKAAIRPAGSPHSAWELLEHMRISQNDILRFSQSADYESPPWPQGYWPASPGPERKAEWNESVRAFKADLAAFEELLEDPERDLYKPFPWGEGQNLLREAMLIADHNSYHLGQLILVRRLLGVWPK